MITQQFSSAIELIRHPERMDRSTVSAIREALEQYPYYQTLHLLLLQNLYKVHDPDFGNQLKKSAVMVADRSVLFDMVEGLNYTIPETKFNDVDSHVGKGDKTLKLIDNFLKGVADMPRGGVSSGETIEPGCDYSVYLEQLPDYGESVDTLQNPKAEAEADFDRENEFTIETINRQLNEESSEDYPADDVSESSFNVTDKDYFTETMAGLYIKQQKYEQALEIIEALNADNPKKSVYFADQIRYLRILVRINRNKNK